MISEIKMNIAADQRWLWMTDVHLDFLDDDGLDSFFRRVCEAHAEGLLITGDIASGTDICSFLARLDECFDGPIGFVLGNHDFYGRSITEVRDRVNALCAERNHLVYLSEMEGIRISRELMLIGQDGWGDGRAGNYDASTVEMNDFGLIAELRRKNKAERKIAIEALADREVSRAEPKLRRALATSRNVVFLTHVPPFPEASVGPDGRSDPNYLPFFCCQSMGSMMRTVMREYPDHRLCVLCGHTHSDALVRVLPNLVVHTAGAVYERPAFAGILDGVAPDPWF